MSGSEEGFCVTSVDETDDGQEDGLSSCSFEHHRLALPLRVHVHGATVLLLLLLCGAGQGRKVGHGSDWGEAEGHVRSN